MKTPTTSSPTFARPWTASPPEFDAPHALGITNDVKHTSLRAVALAGAMLLIPAFAAPAVAQTDNTAVAVNTVDGSSVFSFAFDIKRVGGDVVDPVNGAIAYASCTGCETVAVAIQIVLVSGSPEVVAPQNVAVAVNDDCELCLTLALAYQYVFGAGNEPIHFTKEGKERLKVVKKAFKDLEGTTMSTAELLPIVQALAQEVNDVVANEIVVGPPGQAKEAEAAGTADATATTSSSTVPSSTTTTTTAEPSTTATTATTAPADTTTTTTAPATTTTVQP